MAVTGNLYFELLRTREALDSYANLAGAVALEQLRSADQGRLLAVGGRLLWDPGNRPICLATVSIPASGPAALTRLIVEPNQQGRGIGASLLAEVEELLRECGRQAVIIRYAEDSPHRVTLERLLARSGWESSRPLCRILRIPAERIAGAPWLAGAQRWSVDGVFPWIELSAAERLQVERVAGEPDDGFLSPFIDEESVDTAVSHGARASGRVAGWVIAHRVAADVVRFTTLYVSPQARRTRLAIAMLATAIRRACETYREAIFQCSVHNQAMEAFIARSLAPYISSSRLYRYQIKRLDP